jgi:hypothetical protein
MTAPATEHFSGPIDHSGLPAGVSHDERFIDPEAAVDDALRATHDAEINALEPPDEREGIRSLGNHMLGLLAQEDATERERLGARIILMNGTPTERKLLFLHDAFDSTRQVDDKQQELTPMVREWDVSRSLAEIGDAPKSVRDMVRRADRGEVITREEFEAAIQETMTEVVPHLPVGECVGLLRAARQEDGSLITRGIQDTTLLQELTARIPEADTQVDKAIIAEAVLCGADTVRANSRYGEDVDGERAAEAAQAQVAAQLDPELTSLSTDYAGRVNRRYLSRAIDATEEGVTLQTYATIRELDSSFEFSRSGSGGSPDAVALNSIAEFVGPVDSERYRKVEDTVLSGVYSTDKLEVLSVAAQLQAKPELGLGADDLEQLGTLGVMLRRLNPAERAKVEGELVSLAGEINLSAALEVYQDEAEVSELLDVLRRGDTEALADLNVVLSVPGLAGMLKRGELTYYAGADKNLKVMFTDEMYSEYDSLTQKRKVIVEALRDPEIAAICEDPVTRRAFGDWVSSAVNANNYDANEHRLAYLKRIVEVVQLEGARDALADITSNNPTILDNISMTSIVGTGSQESVLEKLQCLAKLPAGSVDGDLITSLGHQAEAFDKLAELQSYGALDYLGDRSLLGGDTVRYVKWFLNEETGTLREKTQVLNDTGLRNTMIDLKDTFAGRFGSELFMSVNVGEWRARAAGLQQVTQSEEMKALYSDQLLDEQSRQSLALSLIVQENVAGAVERAGQLYRNEGPLLQDMAAIDSQLAAGVIEHWSKEGDSAYLESWQRAINDSPVFWKFISVQGAGYNLRGQIINGLAETDNPHAMTMGLTNMLTKQQPLWLLNMEIAKWAIKDEAYHGGMMVDHIPTSLPVSRNLRGDELDHALATGEMLVPLRDMTVEEKRNWLKVEGMTDEEVAAIHTIAFNDLQEGTQQTALAYRLFETIETSRSERMRQQASERNATFALAGADVWHEGMLTHYTQHEGARASLINGNLAGEMVGFKSQADRFPYNVDFVAANDEVLAHETHAERLEALASRSYGPIAMHYRRDPGSFRQGEEFAVPETFGGQHRLLFGGIPATEVSAMSVREEHLITPLKHDLVRAGLYVPLLDNDGKLVFSPAEYQLMREDRNYDRVRPEVVDGAFIREDSQGGSNEGAEMYIPTLNGEPEPWYVKFAQDDDDHLWTELATDMLYAGVDPDLVPETKAILIDGRFARASKMADAEGSVTDVGRNRGFILDSWVGGWDAVFNSGNLIPRGDNVALRIDNGNALDFRARGSKKGTDNTQPFGPIVSELEFGDDNEELGRGMRQKYLGLTDANIREQVARLREKATDEFIDSTIEGVRRPRADREFLKRTLKARRDYILTYFADL